jgi:hypothetical protein
MIRLTIAASILLACPALGAQVVGSPPAQSPYADLSYRQELTLFTGIFNGSKGSAGVAPTNGPVVGLRYEIGIGGPAQFSARLARAFTERTVLDPLRSESDRNLGTRSWPITLLDAGLTLNLTGQKSWHHLVPVVTGGIGVASDLGNEDDPGGFSLGTPFAFSFGTGLRLVTAGHFQFRADLADYVYQLSYPASYITAPGGGTPILGESSTSSEWKHNMMLTIGASYRYSR